MCTKVNLSMVSSRDTAYFSAKKVDGPMKENGKTVK